LPGNLAEDFKDKGCKFVIILDNASFHKKAATLQKIAEEMPNLIIEFLPKYSPDYNASLISMAFRQGICCQ